MNTSKRVLYNTGFLYIRLLIGMAIGLFTTRLVLQALGETNFGIYVLVGGTVGVLDILKSSMSNASMRFLSHSLGKGDLLFSMKTFNTTLGLHIFIGILTILIMEAGGWLMFEYLLNVPPEKLFDAKVVFHFMVLTTFISIISVPYDAVINSHEHIFVLSLVDIFGYVLKLGIAIYLINSSKNLLIMYGFLLLMVEIILRTIKQWYSRTKYKECKISFRKYFDKTILKSILSFTGWNMFGTLASMSVGHIRGIILNIFFGVSLNAAFGISKRATNPVNMIATSLTRAINPQLVKSEGAGNRLRMLKITELATKFSVYLFAVLAIPIIVEAKYLINLWLKDVPDYAVIFTQLILTGLLIEKFSFEVTSALRAVGKIRNFQLAETSIAILNIPLAYTAFKLGYPPYYMLYIGLSLTMLVFASRLYFGHRDAELNIRSYLKNAVFPVFWPLLIAVAIAVLIKMNIHEGLIRLLISVLVSSGIFTGLFYLWGIKKEEKQKLKSVIPVFRKAKQNQT
jgi:O-antigen/teichoic acid export membrane protein